MIAFARNIQRLLDHHGWSQSELARRSSVGQTTISQLIRYEDSGKVATLDTVQALAKAFGLESWQLQIPNAPIDMLTSKGLANLVDAFTEVSAPARENILRVAESEARYEVVSKTKAG